MLKNKAPFSYLGSTGANNTYWTYGYSLPASYIHLQYIEENEHIKMLNVPGSRWMI